VDLHEPVEIDGDCVTKIAPNSTVPDRTQKQNGPQARSLWAARWTVWDWPRGGHSTWPLRRLRAPDRPASGGLNPYSPV